MAFLKKKTDKPSSFCSKLPSYLSQQVFAFYRLNSQITDGNYMEEMIVGLFAIHDL